MKKIILTVILILSFAEVFGQNTANVVLYPSLGKAKVLQTNDFLSGTNPDGQKITDMYSLAFKIAKQTDGTKPWHHLYHGFRYGAGLFYGRFNYYKNLNNPFALYLFGGFTPFEYKKIALKNEIAFGLSGIWDGYSKDNYMNIAVSLPIQTYIHWNGSLYYTIDPYWQCFLGISFIHFSNGAVKKPNKGINTLGLEAGISYQPDKMTFKESDMTLQRKQKHNYCISPYAGVHAVFVDDSVQGSYGVFGLQFRYLDNISFKHSLGAGADITYNNGFGKNDRYYYLHDNSDTLTHFDRTTISAFLSYNYSINDLSVMIEPGIYIYKQYTSYFPRLYQRIGLRYDFLENWFGQMALRAYNFHVADYIEFGLGYKI